MVLYRFDKQWVQAVYNYTRIIQSGLWGLKELGCIICLCLFLLTSYILIRFTNKRQDAQRIFYIHIINLTEFYWIQTGLFKAPIFRKDILKMCTKSIL